MIAKALDADKTYTAAQVSWKLKQLGLLAPKKLTSPEIEKHSRDDENKEKGLQLEETLFAIKKRYMLFFFVTQAHLDAMLEVLGFW